MAADGWMYVAAGVGGNPQVGAGVYRFQPGSAVLDPSWSVGVGTGHVEALLPTAADTVMIAGDFHQLGVAQRLAVGAYGIDDDVLFRNSFE